MGGMNVGTCNISVALILALLMSTMHDTNMHKQIKYIVLVTSQLTVTTVKGDHCQDAKCHFKDLRLIKWRNCTKDPNASEGSLFKRTPLDRYSR